MLEGLRVNVRYHALLSCKGGVSSYVRLGIAPREMEQPMEEMQCRNDWRDAETDASSVEVPAVE